MLPLWMLCLPLALQAQEPLRKIVGQQQKFDVVFRALNSLYVDEVDPAPLTEAAIRAILEELDPHSAYLDAEEMKGVQASFEGEFSGIGVEFNILKDTVIVMNTIVGGPAERVGVQPNDRIVRIDTVSAVGFKQSDVPKHLRGVTGTKVDIEVVRRGEPEPLLFTIIRDKIPLNTVDAAYKIDEHTGYIKVNRFGHTTMDEFYKAFHKLGQINGLILDLRGNGGGLLEQAIEMTNFFLPKGAVIVSTEGRAVPPATFQALYDGDFKQGRLVVLIDENSASASEIVAGAVQDWDRGVVIGRPSFGKGLVQRQFPLPDGSAVRITIARYHTPSGRVIQRPYEKGQREAYYVDYYKRYGAKADSVPKDTPIYKTLRAGRTVYGGGGITPDIVTRIDTTGVTPYFASLVRRGVVNEYVIGFLAAHRKEVEAAYASPADFATRFEVTNTMLDDFLKLSNERGVTFKQEEYSLSEPLLRMHLRALISQRIYGSEAFYRMVNDTDSMIYSTAKEVLMEWEIKGEALLKGEK